MACVAQAGDRTVDVPVVSQRALLPFFHRHRLSQITVAEVDRYREFKLRERRMAASYINATITRLGTILDVADERELIARNPVRVNPRNRKLKVRGSAARTSTGPSRSRRCCWPPPNSTPRRPTAPTATRACAGPCSPR